MAANPPQPVVTGSVVRVIMTTVTEGQLCQTTHDYLGSGPSISYNDLSFFQAAWDTNNLTEYLACIGTKTQLFSRTVQELAFGTTPSFVTIDTPGTFGSVAAANNPLEVSATLSKGTALKGKHGRGRTQMPAVPLTFITATANGSQLNAAAQSAYQALCNKLDDTLTVGGLAYAACLVTRPQSPSNLVTNAGLLTHYAPQLILGTTRRRKIGRGI